MPAREFAKQVVEEFSPLGSDGVMVGVVTFDHDAYLRTHLSEHPNAINHGIDMLTDGGYTSLSAGLDKASNEFDRNGRDGAIKIIILLSDGEQTADCKGYDQNTFDNAAFQAGKCRQAAIDKANQIKQEKGVVIFAWGFAGVKESTLKAMATTDDYAHFEKDLSALQQFVSKLAEDACKIQYPPPRPPAAPPPSPMSPDGQAFDDPHIRTLSGERYFMHGVGVFEYASAGDIESQVYLCPFAPCTEKMMGNGECLTFISAVAVKTPMHKFIIRDDSLTIDGQEESGSREFKGLTVTAIGPHKKDPTRINHRVLRGCRPDADAALEGGWLWQECTSDGWRFSTPVMNISVGAVGPYEEGWLKEEVSSRTFNLDVTQGDLKLAPGQVRGIINGDKNGEFKPAGQEYQNVLQAANVPQVTANSVSPEAVIFPDALMARMDKQCGMAKAMSVTQLERAQSFDMSLMRKWPSA